MTVDNKEVIDRLTDRLTTEMNRRSWKASPLSKAAGLNESAVRDILRGRSQNPGIVTISRIAELLEVRPGALFEDGDELEVLGHVGDGGESTLAAGSVIEFSEAGAAWSGPRVASEARRARRARAKDAGLDEEGEDRPSPQQALEVLRRNRGMFALEVRTHALEPFAFQGDCLVIERMERDVSQADLGRPCLCVLPTGERRVVRLRSSDVAGAFDLLPLDQRRMVEPGVAVSKIHRVICALPALAT